MAQRSYVIGLPVVITVNDDGTLTAEVDLSEAADIHEDEDAYEKYGEAQLDEDIAFVQTRIESLDSPFRTINL